MHLFAQKTILDGKDFLAHLFRKKRREDVRLSTSNQWITVNTLSEDTPSMAIRLQDYFEESDCKYGKTDPVSFAPYPEMAYQLIVKL